MERHLTSVLPLILVTVLVSIISMGACTAQQGSDYSNSFLVDVRTPAEFAQGSAVGAVNIPLNELPQRMAEFKDKKSIVVFCRSGARSAQAKAFLDSKGLVHVEDGGTWQTVNNKLLAKR
jgi:phage shock protein E